MIEGKFDILVLVETKLDESFPENQFIIEGYTKPYRLDRNCNGGGVFIRNCNGGGVFIRNCNGGGVLIYIRKDIPSKQLKKHNFSKNISKLCS